METSNNKSTITFPCENYPIKIIGRHDSNILPQIKKILGDNSGVKTRINISSKFSKLKNYQSISASFCAESESQLKSIHQQLLSIESVKLVL